VSQFLAGPAEFAGFVRGAAERNTQSHFDRGSEFVEANFLQQVLQARLFAIGAASALNEDSNNGEDHLVHLRRRYDNSQVLSEGLVARGPSKGNSKKHLVSESNGFDANIIGVLD
jgi:hypothetical protein